MNDSAMRRRELLQQARRLYAERRDIPAVHHRYGRVYHNLCSSTDEQQKEQTGGRLHLRLVSGILCFLCFVYMDQSNAGVAEVNSTSIVNQIQKYLNVDNVIEAWENL